MKEIEDYRNHLNRRAFLRKATLGLGTIAMGSLLGNEMLGAPQSVPTLGGKSPHFLPKAKRIVYLFQSGGPSQIDLFDYKPAIKKYYRQDLPDSIRQGQRLTGMSADQTAFPIAPTIMDFKQYGESRTWVSEAMPYLAEVVDDLCFIKSMHTDAINHDPAITFFQTGSQQPGRPSMGAWLSYGLGSDNENLPTFITLVSKNGGGQPLYSRLWGNGFLPAEHQGVLFRSGGDPVLYLKDPENYTRADRRRMLNSLAELNDEASKQWGDPAIDSRMAQYEMAYRMQTSVPEVTDISDEPDSVFKMYGEDSRDRGTYAANCLLARKLLEKDVKFVQLYHQGWDQHANCPGGVRNQSKNTDQATAALIKDLKMRGMLEDTLVVWGGEFGRTIYSQGELTETNYGRDHHPKAFTMFMAGAGVKPGFTYGETDDFSYNITRNPVHTHDFQATLLHLFGLDHEKLTYKHQGRRFRLTDVHGEVVHDILS